MNDNFEALKKKYGNLIETLRLDLSDKRFNHSISVAETSVKISKILGLDAEKVFLASILHDCAKMIKSDELVSIYVKNGNQLDNYEKENPEILHSKVGAFIAKQKYAINDEEILSAIRKHTVGNRQMSRLDLILYISDYIEPTRKYIQDGVLNVYDLLCQNDKNIDIKLYEATLIVSKHKYSHIKSIERKVHMETNMMINELEKAINGRS